jgi:magnesium transporter
MKTIRKKVGLPPGSLIFTGKQHADKVRIDVIDFDPDYLGELNTENIEDCFPYRDSATKTWIDIKGVHDADQILKVGEHFEIHPLVLEDILNTNQRPKIEVFDHYIFIVLKMLSYNEEKNIVDSEQVSFIIGRSYVISLQEKEDDIFDPLRERLRKGKGRIRTMGADYLAYAILDVITDNYFLMLERLGEQMEEFEERLLKGPDQETLKKLYVLKRENLLLRKSVWPLREVITQLERSESPLIKKKTAPFLRDLYDHIIQVIDIVETHRDMTAGLIELYLSSSSNRMNEVMKVLTIIATIFIPLTFIAGVYGMNFANMPELEWPWAYYALLIVMMVIVAGMLLYFRKKKWL